VASKRVVFVGERSDLSQQLPVLSLQAAAARLQPVGGCASARARQRGGLAVARQARCTPRLLFSAHHWILRHAVVERLGAQRERIVVDVEEAVGERVRRVRKRQKR
jgi:hypothetical protein